MKRILSVILMLCFALSLVTGDFSASADTETVYTEKLLKYVEANTEQGDAEFGAYWTPQGSAIIYCDTCGKSMQVRYEKVGRTGKNRFTGEQREPIDKAYYISARPITGWERTPAPATRSRQGICIILF